MVKPLLLFVDDSEMMRQFLGQYFASHYRVQTFENAEQAWSWLDAGHFPDLIVLDLKMPGTTGYDFLVQLKSAGAFRDIPTMILSSIDESKERVNCLQAGAADYVIKPFNPEELAHRIHFHIRQQRVVA